MSSLSHTAAGAALFVPRTLHANRGFNLHDINGQRNGFNRYLWRNGGGFVMGEIFYIELSKGPWQGTYVAVLDNYDGAPDSPNRHELGFERTEIGAIEELIEALDGQDILIDLSPLDIVGECGPKDYLEHIQSYKAKDARNRAEIYAEDNNLTPTQASRIRAL